VTDHFLDTYGHCTRKPPCTCLKTGWVGRLCEYWKTDCCRNPEELFMAAREIKRRNDAVDSKTKK
jgi:hypothetical protein